MTGAALPAGANAVVRLEDVAADERDMTISQVVPAGSHVRAQGEDFRAGTSVLRAGRRLLASEIGALAAVGCGRVAVHRQARIGLLSTGDELVQPGVPLRPGQVYDCNAYLLAVLVRELGAEPVVLGVAGDSMAALRARLSQCGDVDLLVTSGGVSVGDFDFVGEAMHELGVVEQWQLLIKPGKPLAFGDVLGVPLLGLPGNPIAALVAFVQLARPAILRLSGRADVLPPEVTARLTTAIENRGQRTLYARGLLAHDETGWQVTPVQAQGSAQLSGLLHGNALIVVRGERADAGSNVPVQPLGHAVLFDGQR
jgi:molybdopterin molybdotransferase